MTPTGAIAPPGRAARWAAALDARWAATGRTRRTRDAPETAGVHWVPVSAAVIRAQVRGAGPAPPVVLVPDPPNTIEHYAALTDRLASEGRVICLDPPGFSFSSPRPGFAFGLDQQAALIAEVLERLAVRDATLSAGCLGAFAALRLARARPDLIARLALVQLPSAADALRWVRGGYWWLLGTPFLGQLVVGLGKRHITRTWYRACLGPDTRLDEFLTPALAMLDRGGTFCLASGFQLFRPDLLEWPALSQPVRIVWGGADRTHAGTDRRSGLSLVPSAEWEEWPTAGHYPDVEAPDAYARVLRAWR